jgi:hypothetical protein
MRLVESAIEPLLPYRTVTGRIVPGYVLSPGHNFKRRRSPRVMQTAASLTGEKLSEATDAAVNEDA